MKEICSPIDCTGCQACKLVCPKQAIQMREDKKGHIYPFINQASCIDCGLCAKHCPSINKMKKNIPQKVIAGWINEPQARKANTSGGISYALSKMIVSRKGYFCGVIWDKTFNGTRHELTNEISHLNDFQGSKYSHSDTSEIFKRIRLLLQKGETILFTGTPCQVAGLKSFLSKDYKNLYTVDLICHGVPSRKILRDRIDNIERNCGRKVMSLKSREKTPDQYFTSTKYSYDDGTSTLVSVYKDPFYRCFVENFCLRPNCFQCKYAQKARVADLTLGDFWGYEPRSLKFRSFRKGTSVILINTDKGDELFESIKNDLIWEERNFQEASSCNRNLTEPQIRPKKYNEFWERYFSGELLLKLSLEFFPPLDRKDSISRKLKTYLKILLPAPLLGQLKK